MGIAAVQSAMARLYTDAAFRERFYAEPGQVGQELGLGAEEIAQLAGLPLEQVDSFAASLQSKRLGEVCKLLPLSHRALGKEFGHCFRQFARAYVPTGVHRHREDALAFAHFMEQAAPEEPLDPPWALDLILFEAALLGVADPGRRWLAYYFQYNVDELARCLRCGEYPDSEAPWPTLIIWFRLSQGGQMRRMTLRTLGMLRGQ